MTWSSPVDGKTDKYIIREINEFVNEMTVEEEQSITLSGLTRGMSYTFIVHAFIDIPSVASSPASIFFDGMIHSIIILVLNCCFNTLFSSITSRVTLCKRILKDNHMGSS